jgi:hypothetical protein
MIRRAIPAAALLLAITACNNSGTDATGATPSEARQLNEAAAMLDANSVNANAVAPSDQENQ